LEPNNTAPKLGELKKEGGEKSREKSEKKKKKKHENLNEIFRNKIKRENWLTLIR